MIEYLKDRLIDDDLLNAPKVYRTHCYSQHPNVYEIDCLICGSHNITYSEFEHHIWCYDCQKDVLTIHRYAGIFGGPIPIELTHAMGIKFDRLNLKTKEIIPDSYVIDPRNPNYETNHKLYNSTWVKDVSLDEYINKVESKLDGVNNNEH